MTQFFEENKNKRDLFNNKLENSFHRQMEISTGFKQLDKMLDGGLHEGLYLLEAVSGLGKTAFCLQLADQMASIGNDILFYSLDTSKNELIARSISRNTAIIGEMKERGSGNFLTVRDILNPKKFNQLNGKSRRLYNISSKKYFEDTGRNLIIFDSIGTINVDQIRQDIIRHIKYTNHKPIIFIDYLQILGESEEKGLKTDKQIINSNILNLKQLSRDYKIPIFVISGFNRENYNIPADILLSLEEIKKNNVKEDSLDKINGERTTGIKNVSLKVLKNRNGIANVEVPFEFDSRFNYFKEKLEQS